MAHRRSLLASDVGLVAPVLLEELDLGRVERQLGGSARRKSEDPLEGSAKVLGGRNEPGVRPEATGLRIVAGVESRTGQPFRNSEDRGRHSGPKRYPGFVHALGVLEIQLGEVRSGDSDIGAAAKNERLVGGPGTLMTSGDGLGDVFRLGLSRLGVEGDYELRGGGVRKEL